MAHSDALHAPVDDNEQRSVQTLMTSMSPKAKNNQFSLSSMSPMLNLMPFAGDNLPGTFSLTGITRSASEQEILRAKSDAEYANTERGLAESLLGIDSMQKMVTLTSAAKTTLENNHLSQLEGFNETLNGIVMFASQTTHNSEQAINEDFVPVTNNFVILVLDTNDWIGTPAFFESDSLPKIPQIQANYVSHKAISDMEHHAAKTTEKQHDASTPRDMVEDNTLSVAHNNFIGDLKVLSISKRQIADWIMNITYDFQIITTKKQLSCVSGTSCSYKWSYSAHKCSYISTDGKWECESCYWEVIQAAHAENMLQSNIKPLSLKEHIATSKTSLLWKDRTKQKHKV